MESVVEFEQVSKRFVIHHERPRTFQEAVLNWFHRRRDGRTEDFWAVRNLSLAVPPGQMLGIVGANGSGKSTTLKLAMGLLEPTAGRVRVRGRVSGLLELGAGFHPELTGRENVYLNAALLGLKRWEVERRLDSIVAFAEMDRFIDTPVKHYSSGMYVRLGFAVAVHVDLDVLLIDEVFAVGDLTFQAKCVLKLLELRQRGVTIVLVTHDLAAVRTLCDTALWLQEGRAEVMGPARNVLTRYEQAMSAPEAATQEDDRVRRWGSGEIEITGVDLVGPDGSPTTSFRTGEPFEVRLAYRARRQIDGPVFGLAFYRRDGTLVTGPNTRTGGLPIEQATLEGQVVFRVEQLPLLDGSYDLSVSVCDAGGVVAFDHRHRCYPFLVETDTMDERFGLVTLHGRWSHRPAVAAGPRGG